MRRVFALLTLVFLVSCSPKPLGAGVTACLLLDGGASGAGFSEVWAGLTDAHREFGLEIKYVADGDLSGAFARLCAENCSLAAAFGPQAVSACAGNGSDAGNTKVILLAPEEEDWPASAVPAHAALVRFAHGDAAFLAGVAAALEARPGDRLAMLGLDTAQAAHLAERFRAGVLYANENYEAGAVLAFSSLRTASDALAQRAAADSLYAVGVTTVFSASGGTAVIDACRAARGKGLETFVVCSDGDLYANGLYGDGTRSCVLTSAVTRPGVGLQNMVRRFLEGAFPEGQTVLLGLAEDAVGLAHDNPNLSAETLMRVEQARAYLIGLGAAG